MTYEEIAERATRDEAYQQGLLDAALVAKSQGRSASAPPCPAGIVAVYLKRLAAGEMP